VEKNTYLAILILFVTDSKLDFSDATRFGAGEVTFSHSDGNVISHLNLLIFKLNI